MRVVVATVAHRGDDARIVHRQARTLLEAGHSVLLIAPDPGDESRSCDPPGLERVFVRRAIGRKRIRAWVEFVRRLGTSCDGAEVVLVHDPELVPFVALRTPAGVAKVWDVHEDYLAYSDDVQWLPNLLKPPLRWGVSRVHRIALRDFRIILAEDSYQRNFPGCPVIPNTAVVSQVLHPCTDPDRVVYVGRLSLDRGCSEMIEIGRRLSSEQRMRLVLVGAADANCESALEVAHRRGWVEWRGPMPNPRAREVMRGSLAGLSLLWDVANYRHSSPSKIFEYWSEGVPIVSTPIEASRKLIAEADGGVTVSVASGERVVDEVVSALAEFRLHLPERDRLARGGWKHVLMHSNWTSDSNEFVRALGEILVATRSNEVSAP